MIDLTKPVQTRDGDEARIYAQDGGGEWPVHGAVKGECGWESATWTAAGRYYEDGAHQEYERDLVNIPERRRLTGWVNVYDYDATGVDNKVHLSRHNADARADKAARIACVPIDLEYTVGQGL
jgi:hypothetical protein